MEEEKKKLNSNVDDILSFTLSVPPLITHSLDGVDIHQRPKDGYINATEMCKTVKKQFSDYSRLKVTNAYLEELSSVRGIPRTELIQLIQGGTPSNQGTWVHPEIATNLGQWLSPRFAVWVSKWVTDWMKGDVKSYMPPHVARYIKNRSRVPAGHFSMMNEVYLELLAPFDDAGIRLPEKMVPDISTGRMFSGFLRNKGIEPKDFLTYSHIFPDGRKVEARAYPHKYFSDWKKFLFEIWIPDRSKNYFVERLPRKHHKKIIAIIDELRYLPN